MHTAGVGAPRCLREGCLVNLRTLVVAVRWWLMVWWWWFDDVRCASAGWWWLSHSWMVNGWPSFNHHYHNGQWWWLLLVTIIHNGWWCLMMLTDGSFIRSWSIARNSSWISNWWFVMVLWCFGCSQFSPHTTINSVEWLINGSSSFLNCYPLAN